MKKRLDLLSGSVSKNVLYLAMPMVFVMFLQTLFNIVDTIFVGRVSAYAVAAVSMAFAVMFIVIAIGGGLGVGTASVIARKLGANDRKGAELAAAHAIFIGIGISLFITFFGLIFARPIFVLLGAGPNVLPLVLSYVRVLFIGMAFLVMGFVGNSILQGEGDMKTPMKILSFSVILNIALDPIFIFTLGYGVMGAAIATVLSRMLGTIMVWYFLLSNRALLQFNLGQFKYSASTVRDILKVGAPSMVLHGALGVGMALYTKIASLFGPFAIAAYGIGFRLESIAILPALGIAMAVVTIVGQNIGAGNIQRAKQTAWVASAMAAFFAVIVAFVINIFPAQTIAIFNSEPLVVEYGISFIRIVSATFALTTISIIIINAFQGAGNGIIPLFLTVLRLFIIAVPLSYLLSVTFGYGISGLWIGMAASNAVAGVIGIIWFKLSRLFQ